MRAAFVWGVVACGAAAALAAAAVVDRVAVVVGKNVITESEVLEEVRLTGFLNGQPPDLGPEQRRAAAERLVDQQLLRQEMAIAHYPEPPASEAEAMLRQFRREHNMTEAQFRAALEKDGLTEERLKTHFRWQLAVVRFTEQRFYAGMPAAPAPGTGEDGQAKAPAPPKPEQEANRSAPGAEDESAVDRQMDAWLKEARRQTRVRFIKDAFQ
jgi:hypothetical protein